MVSNKAHRRPKRDNSQARRAAALGLLAVGTGAPLGATVIMAPAAQAATISVTNLNDSGAGSLRAAVTAANASAGADTITFSGAGASGVIQLTSGELEITDDVTITGPGSGQVTVSAGGNSRVFNLGPALDGTGPAVVISGLTLADGSSPVHTYTYNGTDYQWQEPGGAIFASGYYAPGAALTLDGVVMTGNTGGRGGAVGVFEAPLTARHSSFTNNTSGGSGGAISNVNGNMSISDVTVSGNTAAGAGGGLWSRSATGTVQSSVISGNSAGGNGGGLTLYGLYSSTGTNLLRDSLVSGNTAAGAGGGVSVGRFYGLPGNVYAIENSTMAGNTATYQGGGVIVRGPAVVTSATISANTASSGGGIASGSNTSPSVRNSIVGGNSATVAAERDLVLTSSYDAPVRLDYSLIQTAPDVGTTSDVTPGSNLFGQDPLLGALADNTGPTKTMKPQPTSPVVDKGKSYGLTRDQRGSDRPVNLLSLANAAGGDGADMGAVELTGTEAGTPAGVDNTGAPSIAGGAQVGATLTATSFGSWSPTGVGTSAQWLRNGSPVPGATGSTYVLGVDDVGAQISLAVTGSKSGYQSTTVTSAAIGPVAPGVVSLISPPRMLGTLKVGKVLKAVPPATSPAPGSVQFQWLRNGKPIKGLAAKRSKYKLVKADRGRKVSVRITVLRPGYAPSVTIAKKAGKVK